MKRKKGVGRYGKNKRFKNNFGTWDSKDEFRRFLFLQDLEKKGTIKNLETKVIFKFELNGVLICKFKPDFRYEVEGETVIEDFKGNFIPRDFTIRVKMLKAFYGHDVAIVKDVTDISPITTAMAKGGK